jgi:hypothetical protein
MQFVVSQRSEVTASGLKWSWANIYWMAQGLATFLSKVMDRVNHYNTVLKQHVISMSVWIWHSVAWWLELIIPLGSHGYCRACGSYMRRLLDWQLDLLDSAQLHNCDYTLQFTVRHTHTNFLSPGVCSLVVTSQLSHNSSGPRTTCRPTHSFRTVDSLSRSFLLSCSARGLLARARNLLPRTGSHK